MIPKKGVIDPKKLKQKSLAFQREVVEKMSALATAAFGLVAALAWNGAIQAVFAQYYPAPGTTPPPAAAIGPLFAYALVITIIAVLIILWIGRFAGRLKTLADAEAAEEAASS